MFATKIQAWGYQNIVKPIIFRRDPEDVHDGFTFMGRVIGSIAPLRILARRNYRYDDAILEQDILGLHFANPVGLSAGFDKNAQLPKVMQAVGFGFEEVGSITGEPCSGNPRPRLWRLPKSKGLVVYYGLKNDGAEVLSKKLKNEKFPLPIGISVAKTNDASTVELQTGIADYVKAFKAFVDIGQYFTINISCPNTCGGEPFTTPERLELLMTELDKVATSKPIFIKMPVDLSTGELDGLVEVCKRHRVHGIILSNLTKKRDRPEIDQTEIAGQADRRRVARSHRTLVQNNR
jgi:dihydroorotate dehydrogenase